jgi:hypothetical protein
VSSSSCDIDRPARRLLLAAFDVLGAEAEVHYRRLCAVLQALAVDLHVGTELLSPRVHAARLIVVEPDGSARVTVRTDLAAAYALLDGRRTLLESVTHGELDIRGAADALDAAADAASIFLHGLVRCRSGAALFDDLRRHVSNPR